MGQKRLLSIGPLLPSAILSWTLSVGVTVQQELPCLDSPSESIAGHVAIAKDSEVSTGIFEFSGVPFDDYRPVVVADVGGGRSFGSRL
jgi:hypothetical protein